MQVTFKLCFARTGPHEAGSASHLPVFKPHCNKLHPSEVSLDKPRPPESFRTCSAHWGCLRRAQPFGTLSNKLQLLGPFVTPCPLQLLHDKRRLIGLSVTIPSHWVSYVTRSSHWNFSWQTSPSVAVFWQGFAHHHCFVTCSTHCEETSHEKLHLLRIFMTSSNCWDCLRHVPPSVTLCDKFKIMGLLHNKFHLLGLSATRPPSVTISR